MSYHDEKGIRLALFASSPAAKKAFNISNVTRPVILYPYPEDLVIAQPRMRFYGEESRD